MSTFFKINQYFNYNNIFSISMVVSTVVDIQDPVLTGLTYLFFKLFLFYFFVIGDGMGLFEFDLNLYASHIFF